MKEKQVADYVDWVPLLARTPKDCWVAFNRDETAIVGHGDTIEAVMEMAARAGETDPILF